jgi:hypothetical protein
MKTREEIKYEMPEMPCVDCDSRNCGACKDTNMSLAIEYVKNVEREAVIDALEKAFCDIDKALKNKDMDYSSALFFISGYFRKKIEELKHG